MGWFRMQSSPKVIISNSGKSSRRFRISSIALDLAFLSMAHTPTVTLRYLSGILETS